MSFQYLACHALSRQLLAPPLAVSEPKWTETINSSGTFECKMAIPDTETSVQVLRDATDPDGDVAIYVLSDDDSYPFAGYLVSRSVDLSEGSISITAVDWRSWLYNVLLPPNIDLSGDLLYDWTNVDQLTIARQLVGYAIAGGVTDGRPSIVIGSETSGKTRDLHIKGLDFKYIGPLLDTISQRSGGFEWGIKAFTDTDGLPRLRLALGFPELGSFQTGIVLKSTANHSNMSVDRSIESTAADRRTRVWTTGQLLETLPYAVDSDPLLLASTRLLSEAVVSYSTVTERTTLASHARSVRTFLNPVLNFLPITIPEQSVDPKMYSAGDRFRLIYADRFSGTLDLPAVRMVERTVTPTSGAGVVSAKLDLTDYQMPDVDEGVTTP